MVSKSRQTKGETSLYCEPPEIFVFSYGTIITQSQKLLF